MFIKVKVKFQRPFKDGNISKETYRAGLFYVLDEALVQKMLQSGAELEIIERMVPNPQKAAKDEK